MEVDESTGTTHALRRSRSSMYMSNVRTWDPRTLDEGYDSMDTNDTESCSVHEPLLQARQPQVGGYWILSNKPLRGVESCNQRGLRRLAISL